MSFGRRNIAGMIVAVVSIASGGLGSISPASSESVAGAKEEMLTPQDVKATGKLRISGDALSVAWSRDGRLLAASTLFFADITIWDSETHEALKTLHRNVSGGDPLAFTADNKFLVTATVRSNSSEDPAEAAAIWDLNSGKVAATIAGPRQGQGIINNIAEALSVNPVDGDIAIAFHGPRQNTVGIFDSSGRLRRSLSVDPTLGPPLQVAFSPNGKVIAIGTGKSMLAIYDTDDLSLRHAITASPESFTQIARLAFSPDGKSIATGPVVFAGIDDDHNDVVSIWDVDKGTLKRELNLPAGEPLLGSVVGLSWRSDGRYIAVSSRDDRMVRIWDVATDQPPLAIHKFSKEAWSVAFSPDGKQLAATGDDEVLLFSLNR